MLPIEEVAPGVLSTEEDKKAVAAYVMAEISEVKKTKYPDLVEKGKKLYDKRESLKAKDDARNIEKALKSKMKEVK